jgi:hypothetical protein
MESQKALVLVNFGRIVHVHTFSEVFPELNCLVDSSMRQFATKLKDEHSLNHLVLLHTCLFAYHLCDFRLLELDLSGKALKTIFFEDVFDLHELFKFDFLVLLFEFSGWCCSV